MVCRKRGPRRKHGYFRFVVCVSTIITLYLDLFTLGAGIVHIYSAVRIPESSGANVFYRNVILVVFVSSVVPNKPDVFKVVVVFRSDTHF